MFFHVLVLAFFVFVVLFFIFDEAVRKSFAMASKDTAGLLRGSWPSVTLIKPVFGITPDSQRCFESWLKQDYPGDVQFIFSLQDANDPALALLESLKMKYPFEVLVGPVQEGKTGKCSNIIRGLESAKNEILIFSDADILATPGTLKNIVSRLKSLPGSLVSCLPIHTGPKNFFARLYAQSWNGAIFYLWAARFSWGCARGMAGATIAMERETLNRLGGFEAYSHYIAEDLAMGLAAQSQGRSILLGPVVDSPVGKMSFSQYRAKIMRGHAAAMSAGMRGAMGSSLGYFAISIHFVLFALAWNQSSLNLGLLGAGFLLLRAYQVARINYLSDKKVGWILDILFLGDPLTVVTFAISLFSRKVTWGNQDFCLDRKGRLTSSV